LHKNLNTQGKGEKKIQKADNCG